MSEIIFIYNIVITAAYMFCCVNFLILYKKFHEKCFIYISLVFFLFTLDSFVLYMHDFLPSFQDFFHTVVLATPFVTNLTTFAIIYSYRLTLVSFTDEAISTKEILMWMAILVAEVAAIALIRFPVAFVTDFIILHSIGIGVFAYSLRNFHKHKGCTARDGVPRLHISFVIISMVLQIACAVEVIFQYFGYVIYDEHRIVFIELVGIFYTAAAIIFIIRTISIAPVSASSLASAEVASTVQTINPKALEQFGEKYGLTPREQDILGLLIEGHSVAEICEIAHIALGTVKTHTHNIYQKMEIKNRLQLSRLLSSFQVENEKN